MHTFDSQFAKDLRKAGELAFAGAVIVAQAAVFYMVVSYFAHG